MLIGSTHHIIIPSLVCGPVQHAVLIISVEYITVTEGGVTDIERGASGSSDICTGYHCRRRQCEFRGGMGLWGHYYDRAV